LWGGQSFPGVVTEKG